MKYTLITGACGGLGRAFCFELAGREPLLLTGRSEERLFALKSELLETFPAAQIQTIPCELSAETSRRAFWEEAEGRGIRLSRLIYVAGIDTQMAFEKYDEGRAVRQTRVNFEGAVEFARESLSRMDKKGEDEILFVGSVSGISPMPYFALYSATKKALEQFSSALRVELKGRVKVTCVLPGSIPTREDIKENIRAHGFFGRLSALPPETVAKKSLKAVQKNKRRKTIGGWNKLINGLARLLPMPLRLRLIARIWQRTEKDYYRE